MSKSNGSTFPMNLPLNFSHLQSCLIANIIGLDIIIARATKHAIATYVVLLHGCRTSPCTMALLEKNLFLLTPLVHPTSDKLALALEAVSGHLRFSFSNTFSEVFRSKNGPVDWTVVQFMGATRASRHTPFLARRMSRFPGWRFVMVGYRCLVFRLSRS